MVSFLEAQKIIKQHAHSFGTEHVELDDAFGRVLAEEVCADRDYPPFNRSAMDGFAIRKEDFDKGLVCFKIADTIFAGKATTRTLSTGECFKIMTGASVPLSADVVVRKEDTTVEDNEVRLDVAEIKSFQNIAKKGEDVKEGEAVLSAGIKISASITGLLATMGKHKVLVEKLPSVAIITTGDEVVAADVAVGDVQIRNSNLPVLKSLIKNWSISPSFCLHVRDNVEELREALKQALLCDVVMISGGVSAGDADYIPQILDGLGVENLFYKVAIKPGKPIWCGHTKEGKMVFALPGNPFSCLVTYTLFIQTFLEACFGVSSPSLMLPLKNDRNRKVPLDEFFPVCFSGNPTQLVPVGLNGSGDIRLAYQAHALALHSSASEMIKAGDCVFALPL